MTDADAWVAAAGVILPAWTAADRPCCAASAIFAFIPGNCPVAAPVMARGAGRTAPALRVPVMGYIGVLLAMGAASTRLADDVDPRAAATIRSVWRALKPGPLRRPK